MRHSCWSPHAPEPALCKENPAHQTRKPPLLLQVEKALVQQQRGCAPKQTLSPVKSKKKIKKKITLFLKKQQQQKNQEPFSCSVAWRELSNALRVHLLLQQEKNPPAGQETQEIRVPSPGREEPLEKGMATHSSTLAWGIQWTGKPSGVQPMGLQRHDWATVPSWVPLTLIMHRSYPGTLSRAASLKWDMGWVSSRFNIPRQWVLSSWPAHEHPKLFSRELWHLLFPDNLKGCRVRHDWATKHAAALPRILILSKTWCSSFLILQVSF